MIDFIERLLVKLCLAVVLVIASPAILWALFKDRHE